VNRLEASTTTLTMQDFVQMRRAGWLGLVLAVV
jgi:hypothetical protein